MNPRTFAIVRRPDELSGKISERIREAVKAAGHEENETRPGTVIVVGGDGTFLNAVHRYLHCLNDVRFIGIHTGTLGFYTDYQDTEVDAFLADFLEGDLAVETYPVLVADTGREKVYAINEIRVENPYWTQAMDVLLDDVCLEHYLGSGLLISTALGSTAYNRSLGGAVLEKGLPLMQLTEMAGLHHVLAHSLRSPFVMSDDTVIRLQAKSYEKAILGADADVYPLDGVSEVLIRKADDKKLHVLVGKRISYFDRLARLS